MFLYFYSSVDFEHVIPGGVTIFCFNYYVTTHKILGSLFFSTVEQWDYTHMIYFICVACSVGRFGVDCQQLCQCDACDAASGSCPGIIKT